MVKLKASNNILGLNSFCFFVLFLLSSLRSLEEIKHYCCLYVFISSVVPFIFQKPFTVAKFFMTPTFSYGMGHTLRMGPILYVFGIEPTPLNLSGIIPLCCHPNICLLVEVFLLSRFNVFYVVQIRYTFLLLLIQTLHLFIYISYAFCVVIPCLILYS